MEKEEIGMFKLLEVGKRKYVIRYIALRDKTGYIAEPNFFGLRGYALCGVLKKNQSLKGFINGYNKKQD